MRLDRFTNQLQVALSDAQSLAVGRDHNQLDGLHLLHALLEQQGGAVKPLLVSAQFDVNRLRQLLMQGLDNLPRIKNPTGEVAMSQDLGRLLNLADKAAQQQGDSFISSEAVLFAAMSDGNNSMGKLLLSVGKLASVQKAIEKYAGRKSG